MLNTLKIIALTTLITTTCGARDETEHQDPQNDINRQILETLQTMNATNQQMLQNQFQQQQQQFQQFQQSQQQLMQQMQTQLIQQFQPQAAQQLAVAVHSTSNTPALNRTYWDEKFSVHARFGASTCFSGVVGYITHKLMCEFEFNPVKKVLEYTPLSVFIRIGAPLAAFIVSFKSLEWEKK